MHLSFAEYESILAYNIRFCFSFLLTVKLNVFFLSYPTNKIQLSPMNCIQNLYFYFQSVTGLLKPQPVANHQSKYIISPLLIATDAHITLMHNRLKITRFNP